MADATVTPIPTRLNDLDAHLIVCGGDDWMIECDGCGRRMPPFEPLRGDGDEGLSIARAIAESEGWTSDPERDRDLCPGCRRSESHDHWREGVDASGVHALVDDNAQAAPSSSWESDIRTQPSPSRPNACSPPKSEANTSKRSTGRTSEIVSSPPNGRNTDRGLTPEEETSTQSDAGADVGALSSERPIGRVINA